MIEKLASELPAHYDHLEQLYSNLEYFDDSKLNDIYNEYLYPLQAHINYKLL